MSLKESRFSKRVKTRLKEIDNCWYFVKEARSIRGIPDVIGVCNGRFFAMELKKSRSESLKKSGRIVLQKYILQLIRNAGGLGYLVHPDNLDDVIQDLVKNSFQEYPRK